MDNQSQQLGVAAPARAVGPTPYYEDSKAGIVIYHGDCRAILPGLGAVGVGITDPPYEITASGGGIGATRKDLNKTEGFTDCGFDYSLLSQFDSWACFGTLRQVPKLIECAADRRWMLITWNKPNPCPLVNGNYLPDTEYIIHAWRSGQLFGDVQDKARYIVHPLGDKEHGEHPNEKPLRVMKKIISTATDRGGFCAIHLWALAQLYAPPRILDGGQSVSKSKSAIAKSLPRD